MESLDRSGRRMYSVLFVKSVNKKTVLEEYQYGDMIVRLPFGALLFTVVEAELQHTEITPPHVLYNLYYLSEAEKKQIARLTEFVVKISQREEVFDRCSLKKLFYTILPRGHTFFYLFDDSGYRFRRLRSKLTLPYGNSTEFIFNKLAEQYTSFSFSAQTEFHTLTELCALSLFEILESGQIVHRCACGRWFVSEPLTKQCGNCKRQRTTDYYRSYSKKKSVQEFKKVYNKLFMRTKRSSQSLSDFQLFEAFKNEWALLKIKYHNSPDFEQKKIEFLQSERWK
ncbi:MAG: hypothetical protein IJ598_05780 [Ruminococcus sp.]|nr:hypothetical protein [Ruminococcus sp.]